MPKLLLTLRSSVTLEVMADEDASVMEAIRDAGVDELSALCGGCCSCATCHVFIDPAWSERLPPMSEDENDLLDSSEHRGPTSRLACQIPFVETLNGLKLTIAPQD